TLENYRKYKEREKEAAELALKNSRLETQLAKSQLQALKMQLQPHFLFNTLHTINWLMLKDVEAAASTITLLSDLLRISLEMTDKQEITLKDELEFIQKYIEIQKTRFKDRLNVEIDIQPETLDAAVPTLILQPITENAFAHGISPHERKGIIKIASRKENGTLVMEVHDNGDGIDPDKKTEGPNGIGLSNSRERLRQIYSEKHSFGLKDSSLGGLLVQIEIPYKKLEESE
ncbi:MAG: sensor histidine kinase, partial [bacterium]|nr:sensor histidine kinase [bacterium]